MSLSSSCFLDNKQKALSAQVSTLSWATGRGLVGKSHSYDGRGVTPRSAMSRNPRYLSLRQGHLEWLSLLKGGVTRGRGRCVCTLPPLHRLSGLYEPYLHSGMRTHTSLQRPPQPLEIHCHVSLWENHGVTFSQSQMRNDRIYSVRE